MKEMITIVSQIKIILIIIFFSSFNGYSQNFLIIKHSGLSNGIFPLIIFSDDTLQLDKRFKNNYLKVYNERITPKDIYINQFVISKNYLNDLIQKTHELTLNIDSTNMSKNKIGPIDIIIKWNSDSVSKFTIWNYQEVQTYLLVLKQVLHTYINLDQKVYVIFDELIRRITETGYTELKKTE